MDYYSDTHKSILQIINTISPLPDFVKQANIIDKDTIPEHMFADKNHRSFPTHDPASTYLSFAYYCLNKESLDKGILENIVKAANFFGITDSIKEFATRYSLVQEKKAEQKENEIYAVPETKEYPVYGKDQIGLAQDHFNKHAEEYPIEKRIRIAKFLQKKASDYKYPIVSHKVTIYSTGDSMVSDTVKTARDVAYRGFRVENIPGIPDDVKLMVKNAYYNLGNNLVGASDVSIDLLCKFTEVLEGLDKMAGIMGKEGVPCAFSTVFNLPVKEAQESIEIVKLMDDIYNVNDLVNIPKITYESAMGKEFVDAIEDEQDNISKQKLLEIIPTLPMEDKEILKQFIDSQITSEKINNKSNSDK